MNCELTRDLLPLYLDGEVLSDTRKSVRLHLATCPACRSYLRSLTLQRRRKANPSLSLPSGASQDYASLARRLAARRNRQRIAMGAVLTITLSLLAFVIFRKDSL